jgi:hypothetical protein
MRVLVREKNFIANFFFVPAVKNLGLLYIQIQNLSKGLNLDPAGSESSSVVCFFSNNMSSDRKM